MYIKGQRTTLDATTRKVESMFYREKEIRKAVADARLDSGTGGHTGGGGHAWVSDPTAIQGMKMATPLKSVTLWDGAVVHQPEQWLAVIDATYNSMDALQRKAVRMRYTGESYTKISDTLHISRNVYYAILDDARKFAVAAACQYKLVTVM